MGASEHASSEMWRLIGGALLLAFLCAGAALMTLRANAQAPAVTAAPAVPAVPGGEIRDDPTVAPDPTQKADDNVSFPVDI